MWRWRLIRAGFQRIVLNLIARCGSSSRFKWPGIRIVLTLCCMSLPITLQAANTGTITGRISDPTGAVLPGARVECVAGTKTSSTTTDQGGQYRFEHLPLERFTLSVEASGFTRVEYMGELHDSTPLIHNIVFKSISEAQQITVIEERAADGPGRSDTHYKLAEDFFERTPIANPQQAMSAVVESVPGVVPEENGRIHVRGSEVQPQFVLDGIPLSANVSGTFATALDTENLESAQVITGNIPPEFGDKVAAVVNLNTKSGLQMPWRGSLAFSGGSFNSRAVDLEIGGHVRNIGIFVTADGSQSSRFLDPPEIESFHNRGGLAHLFSRLDWQPTRRDILRISLAMDGTGFQVPNLLEQQIEGQKQRQELRGNYQALNLTHSFDVTTLGDFSIYRRSLGAKLLDPELTGAPFFITEHRQQREEGLSANISKEWSGNFLKGGFEVQRLPLNERFTLAVRDAADVDSDQPVAAFSLTRPFQFAEKRTGTKAAWYLHDRVRIGEHLTADLGLRGDYYDLLVHDTALSARLGIAYRVGGSNTVIRASYNRLFQTPPLENLLLSSSSKLAVVSEKNAPDNVRRVPAERQNSYEFGVQQPLGSHLRVDVSRYIKNIKSFLDDQQLFTTGVVFPVALAGADIRGTEVRLDLLPVRGVSAYASYANARSTATGPLLGGLLLSTEAEGELVSGGQFRADQDERNELQFGITFTHKSGAWLNFTGRHDSGLPANFEADDLPSFDPLIQRQLDAERLRIRPHTVLSATTGVELRRETRYPIGLQLSISNLTDQFYLHNFHSVFSGTHIGRPREIVGKIIFRWNGTK